jgi:lysophospholipase L1-like esterase
LGEVRGWLACAGALVFASCATLPQPAPLTPGAHYVALGSSYAAGANIPPLADDRPLRCGASQASYSRLLAARLALDLTDASCGGATTDHLLVAWDELPAQIDALRADTRLVTVTVGGNDLNYMGLMFTASCHAGVANPRAPEGSAEQCPPLPVPAEADYAAAEDRLGLLFAAIRRRAPLARVVLVQYVALTGETSCEAAPLLPEQAAITREVARRLALASSRAARRGGAEVLPVDVLSRDHTPCSPDPWSRGHHAGYDGAQGAPWHPTAAGHAAIAEKLAELLAART